MRAKEFREKKKREKAEKKIEERRGFLKKVGIGSLLLPAVVAEGVKPEKVPLRIDKQEEPVVIQGDIHHHYVGTSLVSSVVHDTQGAVTRVPPDVRQALNWEQSKIPRQHRSRG